MILICYPKWTTCKKAEAWLKENQYTYLYRDIKTENPSKLELASWYGNSDIDIKKLFNTSGNVYKDLNLKDKIDKMRIDEKLELLASDGMLLKRPFLVYKDKIKVGFKENEWISFLNET